MLTQKQDANHLLATIKNVLVTKEPANVKLQEILNVLLSPEEHRILSSHQTLKNEVGIRPARTLLLELMLKAQHEELDRDEIWERLVLFDLINE